MSVRVTGSQGLTRTTNLPSWTSYTVCGWARLNAAITSGYQVLALAEDSTTAASLWNGIFCDANGLQIVWPNGGAQVAVIANPAAGVDFFWAVTINGSGSGGVTGYFRGVGANSLTIATSTSAQTVATMAMLGIGINSYGGGWNGRIWNVAVWDRALSARELLLQSFQQRLFDLTSLNFWLPMVRHDLICDFGPNRRDPTITGTLTTEPHPPFARAV